MSETDLTVFGNRSLNAERLQTDTDCSRRIGSFFTSFFNCNRCADRIRPNRILKTNRLRSAHDLIAIDSLFKTDIFALFN